ncbi:hypothetical protein [Bacillus cereus]|uniref:Uncharacterized protein n=1 Tax=Bacillus cereus VD184 TaxID=1053242 RepID=A0A9W5R5J3_BACCE|nr:hypothetical protein [Bacillus cereus]EOQ08291.1 hypothetical protein IKC_04968 [Bacillus cereus VD184]
MEKISKLKINDIDIDVLDGDIEIKPGEMYACDDAMLRCDYSGAYFKVEVLTGGEYGWLTDSINDRKPLVTEVNTVHNEVYKLIAMCVTFEHDPAGNVYTYELTSGIGTCVM